MSQCIGWYNEFKRNMDTLNAPVPENFFDSYDKAIGTIGALVAAANISPGASAAVVFAGEFGGGAILVGLAALSASAYAGMAVGSWQLAVGSWQLAAQFLLHRTNQPAPCKVAYPMDR